MGLYGSDFVCTNHTYRRNYPSEWRPVGIVSSEETANQWAAHGGNNDWISFIVDDLSLTGLSGEKSQFESKPPRPTKRKSEI